MLTMHWFMSVVYHRFAFHGISNSLLSRHLKDTVDDCIDMDDSARVGYRLQRVGYWLKQLKELREDERDYKSKLRPDVAKILADNSSGNDCLKLLAILTWALSKSFPWALI